MIDGSGRKETVERTKPLRRVNIGTIGHVATWQDVDRAITKVVADRAWKSLD